MANSFSRYKDIDISFRKNPISRDVSPLTDIDSIKRSVKLLVMTNYFERTFQPGIGSNVYYHLFENFTPFTLVSLKRSIKEVIDNFEPRANVLGVDLSESSVDSNILDCKIIFSVKNVLDPVVVSFTLEKLR